jgi:hypothetical protein
MGLLDGAVFSAQEPDRSAGAIDRRARWGIVLESAGYMLLWIGPFWTREAAAWRVPAAALFLRRVRCSPGLPCAPWGDNGGSMRD